MTTTDPPLSREDSSQVHSSQVHSSQGDSVKTSSSNRSEYPSKRTEAFPHWLWFGVCCVVLLLSFLLQTHQGTHVKFPYADAVLPEICMMKRTCGMPCPGCGLTRSFISIAHGDFVGSLHYNPVGFMIFAAMLFQFPYRIFQLRRIYQGHPAIKSRTINVMIWVILACLPIQWLWRMIEPYWM